MLFPDSWDDLEQSKHPVLWFVAVVTVWCTFALLIAGILSLPLILAGG